MPRAVSQPLRHSPVRRLLCVLVLACLGVMASVPSASAATQWELDPTFGAAGSLVLPADHAVYEVRSAADGGFWVLGVREDVVTSRPMVGKVSADGVPDPGFGSGGFSLDLTNVGRATDIVELSDGDLLVSIDVSAGGMRTWRLAPDGSARVSWGTAGVLTVGDPSYRAELLALTPDGNVIIAGERHTGGPVSYISTARLDVAAEALDPAFGIGGVRDSDSSVSNTFGTAGPAALLVAPDGSITIAYQYFSLYVERYLPDGTFNTSFAGDGTVVDPTGLDPVAQGFSLDAGGTLSYAHEFAISDPEDPQGVIVKGIGGDGTAQPGYGVAGAAAREIETIENDSLSVTGHARLPDGSSLVTGGIWGSVDNSAFSVRMTPEGTVDTTHGFDGVAAMPTAPLVTDGI
ncbi:MAG: hypothetical protein JWM90_1149, partial [Thermoleophilia bacterium]|nr:hypothetical protein [Thermoleophilia bacterium]